ncbi:AI-2E family transporter [Noviherbaspirillum sp.]|uniref:AI-2E family transporter n=1 Tax=Noviherbaspirillum sp. TaxID=1926288 RepID=UPI002D59A33A|nr:AI-2E family transporter [Noviherbaspirillum sp.]HZW22484.1 AI-2E family transporter [Noviherbaspirillum sp.]
MTTRDSIGVTRMVLLWLLLGGLFILSYLTLRWFIVPVVWALILAYATWPIYARLRRGLHGAPTASALLMTLLLTAAFVLPLLALIGLLQNEFILAYQAVSGYINEGPQRLPSIIKNIPWVGERLQQIFDRIAGDPAALRTEALQLAQNWFGQVAELVGGVGRNAAKMALAVLTVLFVYRDGEKLLYQVRRVMRRFVGPRAEGYLEAIGATTKAVLYGLVLTALAQGTLAGLGYWAAGIHAPALLGAFTALIALIPFGAPVIWGSLGVWLLMTGETLEGIGLLLWGALVVSWVDNLIRPLVISSAAQIPFILVLFAVLGGLGAFGLVGMFVGPVIVAVLLAVWREWLEERMPDEARVHRLHE